MSPADMIAKLDELHRTGKFFGLTIWPTKDGYQVNLATTSKNNWRIRRADTPSEGLALVLDMDFMDSPDLPRTSRELLGEEELLAPPAVDEPPELMDGHGDLMDFDEQDIAEIEEANAEARDEAGIFD